MIRTLSEIRAARVDASVQGHAKSLGRLAITLLAVSQLDDIWTFVCNGDAIGEECPVGNWEPGETSSLEDTVATMKAHAIDHGNLYHPAPESPAPVVHAPVKDPMFRVSDICRECGNDFSDQAQHGLTVADGDDITTGVDQ